MYIKTSELEKVGNKNYLRLFLDPKYSFIIKSDDKEKKVCELFFEEPNAHDISQLRRLGVSLEKLTSYQSLKSIKSMNMFSKETLDEFIKNAKENKEELDQESDDVESCRSYITDLFTSCADFENDDTDYFKELNKFYNFLEAKMFRMESDVLLSSDFSIFGNLTVSNSSFVKEAIVIEYISFFFDHFPSKSLHQVMEK